MLKAKVKRLIKISSKQIATIILLLFVVLKLQAQEISFSHITVNDGLLTNFVNCVCQDKKGFLWIGTENGLQRYDGNSFKSISSPKNHFPILPVENILYDSSRNVLWVSMGAKVGRYAPSTGEYIEANLSVKSVPNGIIYTSLKIDSKNHVLFMINGVGVFVYDNKNNSFKENKAVINVPENFGIISIYEDAARGWFYLGGRQGLNIYDQNTKKNYSAENNPLNIPELTASKGLTFIQYVLVDSKKRFWINSWPPNGIQNLCLFNALTNKLETKSIQQDISSTYTENLGIIENNKNVFCYGTNLLNIYDENESQFTKFYSKTNLNTGINFSIIKQIFQDADKNLWIISDNGLYQTTVTNNYIKHGTLLSFLNKNFTSIRKINDSTLLCTGWGGGVSAIKYDSKNLSVREDSSLKKIIYNGVPDDDHYYSVWGFINDTAKHQLLFGCQSGRMILYNTISKRSTFFRPTAFEDRTALQLIKDSDGNYWYGLSSGKIIKQQNDVYTTAGNYYNSFITKLFIDNKGLLWACTFGDGIHVLDRNSNKEVVWYHSTNNEAYSIASNQVKDVVQLNDSIYIICLSRNLDVLNVHTKKVKHFTTANGLPNNTVYGAVKDANNKIWMVTNDGIANYNWGDSSFHAFTKKDGLVTVMNNDDLLYTGILLDSKYVMFGGEKGNYIIFNTDSISDRNPPKNVTITDIRLFNKYLPVDSILKNGFHLSHDQNSITIDFNALMYAGATKLKYYYRLLGSSDHWIKADKSYSASFASLSPGDYTFEVKCQNADGIFSDYITALNIEISKAYWQTWWFIALIIIVALIPVYIIYTLRIRRLQAVQKIRERVARDLHDDVGSTLTSINILSEMSKGKVRDENNDVKDYLNRISNTSSQMMDAMDDIVWNIKPANDTMEKIEARMREYAASVFEPKDIAYRFIDNEKIKTISLNMDVRRSLFLIFKETLNNIAKYANANAVTVQFELSNSQLLVTIIDDGIGFDETKVVYGNGIENMQKRSKSFRGNYVIKSYPNKGTHVVLTIPLSRYYT